MELGLFEDADKRFSRAIEICDHSSTEVYVAARYGRSVALAALAQQDNQDGKSGLAMQRIQQAVDGCREIADETKFVCVEKLVGDLYTLAASLPPNAFAESESTSDEEQLQLQLRFMSNGEAAFRAAVDLIGENDEESNIVRASLLTDAGVNLLLQAHLLSSWERKGLHRSKTPKACAAFENAGIFFRQAIDVCPTFAPSWCGYGCALAQSDPIMAQHAFSRSLELDKLSPDSYANLGFLLTHFRKFAASGSVLDALTEVADTPMMWINRAFILECQTALTPHDHSASENMQQAADAYRAALQVVKHPSAMLGLAMTCRMSSAGDPKLISSMMYESHNYTTEYLGVVGRVDVPTTILNGVFSIESALQTCAPFGDAMVDEGQAQILQGISQLANGDLTDGRNTMLDTTLLRQVAEKHACPTTVFHEEEEIEAWSLDRQILHEPNRGDLWVQFAKDLVSKDSAVPAARIIQKGALILMQQVSGLLALPRDSHFVNAQDLSDALSLWYWLENHDQANIEGGEAPSVVDLQRSILISPGNPIARAALGSLSQSEQ